MKIRLLNLVACSVLGPGVPGLDVTDPNFDIDAAIDASAAADPSIAGTAGILFKLCGVTLPQTRGMEL